MTCLTEARIHSSILANNSQLQAAAKSLACNEPTTRRIQALLKAKQNKASLAAQELNHPSECLECFNS